MAYLQGVLEEGIVLLAISTEEEEEEWSIEEVREVVRRKEEAWMRWVIFYAVCCRSIKS